LPQLTFGIVTGTMWYTWEIGFGYVGGGNITCHLCHLCIPVKNALAWSAVLYCKGRLILLCKM